MDNETLSSFISQLIQDDYLTDLQLYFSFSSVALLVYASLLSLSDEVEHIWKPKLTLPAYLYLLTKYPLFLFVPTGIIADLATELSLSQCNDVGIWAGVVQLLSFIGIQGLVSIRTYSLCQGYRPMTAALSITFLIAVVIQIFVLTFPSCTLGPVNDPLLNRLFLVQTVAILLSDALAFIGVLRQVWGLWRLKRSLGLQSNDFLTLLLQQGTLSFCFVLSISIAQVFLATFNESVVTFTIGPIQPTISALIVCQFTLDLRRRNIKKSISKQSALSLPTLSFQENPAQSVRTVLGRLHESILAEMGETNDPPTSAMDPDGPVSRVSGDLENGLLDTNSVASDDSDSSRGDDQDSVSDQTIIQT